MKTDLYQQATVALKTCSACGREMIYDDRFCRRCGASQGNGRASRMADPAPTQASRSACSLPMVAAPMTSGLPLNSSPRLVSGSLVTAIAGAVSVRAAVSINSRVGQRLIFGLISLPIWLLIILLSPLDAYLAAKAVCR